MKIKKIVQHIYRNHRILRTLTKQLYLIFLLRPLHKCSQFNHNFCSDGYNPFWNDSKVHTYYMLL